MAYRDFKDLLKKTVADKVLRDKAFTNVKNPKYNGHQRYELTCFIHFLIERLRAVLLKIKSH